MIYSSVRTNASTYLNGSYQEQLYDTTTISYESQNNVKEGNIVVDNSDASNVQETTAGVGTEARMDGEQASMTSCQRLPMDQKASKQGMQLWKDMHGVSMSMTKVSKDAETRVILISSALRRKLGLVDKDVTTKIDAKKDEVSEEEASVVDAKEDASEVDVKKDEVREEDASEVVVKKDEVREKECAPEVDAKEDGAREEDTSAVYAKMTPHRNPKLAMFYCDIDDDKAIIGHGRQSQVVQRLQEKLVERRYTNHEPKTSEAVRGSKLASCSVDLPESTSNSKLRTIEEKEVSSVQESGCSDLPEQVQNNDVVSRSREEQTEELCFVLDGCQKTVLKFF